jgi:hypothetical protein
MQGSECADYTRSKIAGGGAAICNVMTRCHTAAGEDATGFMRIAKRCTWNAGLATSIRTRIDGALTVDLPSGWFQRCKAPDGGSMTSTFCIATAMALAISSVGVGAQTAQSSAKQGASPAPGGSVTITGCVQRGEADGSLAGTALGTSVPPADAGPTANVNPAVGFMLTDATPVSSAARSGGRGGAAVGTGGAAGSDSGVNRTSYALEGAADELTKHLGHRMEVTGTIAPVAASGAGTTPSPGASGDARAQAGTPAADAASNGHP